MSLVVPELIFVLNPNEDVITRVKAGGIVVTAPVLEDRIMVVSMTMIGLISRKKVKLDG